MKARWGLSACIALVAGCALAAPAPDFADGLAGGPDYWRVTGLCLSARPTLQEAPAPHAKRIAFLAAGTIVKNHGCRMAHGARWCKVESVDEPVLRGWMAGNCLREAAGPK